MDPARIIFIGRIGKDPEFRYASTGTPMCQFSVAVSGYKNKQTGEESTSWWRCICYDKKAEFVNQYLHKGSKVQVDGRPEMEEWVGQDGTKRKDNKITIHEITNLDPRDSSNSNGHSNGHAPLEELAPVAVGAVVGVTEDDDKDPFADE